MRVLLLILLPMTALAQVHKCIGADGAVRFSDRPCPPSTTAEQVNLRKDMPSNPYIPVIAEAEPLVEQETAPIPAAQYRNPRASYQCQAGSGEVWYSHVGCPRSVRGATGTLYRRGDGSTMSELNTTEVLQTEVTRREACKAINAVDADKRFGAARDQRATTQDKATGRDKC